MDDPSPLWPDTTLAAFPGVSVPSVVSSPSRLSRSHPDDSDESLRSAAGGGGSRSSEDCSYDSSVLGGGGGGCDGGGGGGGGGLSLGGCGAGCFFLTAPSREEDEEDAATAAAVVLCLRVEPCESVGDVCLGGEDVFGGSGGGGGEPVLVGVTEVTVVTGGEEKELDDVGEVFVVGGENCGGENCIVGGLAYLEGGTAYGGDVIGVDIGGEGVEVDDLWRGGDLALSLSLAVGEGVVSVIGGESPGEDFWDFGGDGAEGWMGCGRSGVALGVILVIMSSPLPLPLRLPSPMSGSPPRPPWPPVLRGASDDESSDHFSFLSFPTMDSESESIGKGKTMVELCSVEMALSVCRYRSCSAEVDSSRTSAASFKCFEAFCSPSAATTLARASRAASASAAIALWSCTGTLTSLISTRSTCNRNSVTSIIQRRST